MKQPELTLDPQRSVDVHLRVALLLSFCGVGQSGAFVNAPLDILEHHKHIMDPCGVACQLCDLWQHKKGSKVTLP